MQVNVKQEKEDETHDKLSYKDDRDRKYWEYLL